MSLQGEADLRTLSRAFPMTIACLPVCDTRVPGTKGPADRGEPVRAIQYRSFSSAISSAPSMMWRKAVFRLSYVIASPHPRQSRSLSFRSVCRVPHLFKIPVNISRLSGGEQCCFPVFFIYATAACGGVKIYSSGISNPIADNRPEMVFRHFRVVFETNLNGSFSRARFSIASRAPSTGAFPHVQHSVKIDQ